MSEPSSQFDLTHAVAVVTGSGRGIGRATAMLLAQHGARVVLCARTEQELLDVMTEIRQAGGQAVATVADIGSPREARAVVELALTQYGQLDILVNNAGILGPRVPLFDYPTSEWDDVLRINLSGTFYVTREAVRAMRPRGRGCVITLSSSVGRVGRADWGAYAVSKFGVEGLTQVLADDLRSTAIKVLTFNPGGTRTRMRAAAYPGEDPSRLRDPATVAEALLRLILWTTAAASGQGFDFDHLPRPPRS